MCFSIMFVVGLVDLMSVVALAVAGLSSPAHVVAAHVVTAPVVAAAAGLLVCLE